MKPIATLQLITATMLALTTTPALCAGQDLSGTGPIPFNAFDSDGDGYVSPQEFDAARAQRIQQRSQQQRQFRNMGDGPGFSDIDTDGDGRLNREEITAHQRERHEHRWADPGTGGTGQGPGMGGGKR